MSEGKPRKDRSRSKKRAAPPVEGVDFYFEKGFVVFTEHYLRERGFCCRSGCRHCPYGFRKEKEQSQ